MDQLLKKGFNNKTVKKLKLKIVILNSTQNIHVETLVNT